MPVMCLAAGMLLQIVAISRLTRALTLGRGPMPVMRLAVGMLLQRVASSKGTCACTLPREHRLLPQG